MTALSKKAEIYIMKICEMNADIQEFWALSISKYIEMRPLIDEDKSKNYDSQIKPGSMNQHSTVLELFKYLSKNKISSKKKFDCPNNNSKYQYNISSIQNNMEILNNNELSKSQNKLKDYEEQRNLLLNMDKIKNKNTELLKENNNLLEIIERNKKTNNTLIAALKEENKNLKNEFQKNKLNAINEQKKFEEILKQKESEINLAYEKKISEYQNEILKLNKILKENENKYNREKKILEEKIKITENALTTYETYKEENNKIKEDIKRLENENSLLKTYKEYKNKYEKLLLNKEENMQKLNGYDMEDITKTKEKLLSALKNNINIQKDNEHLRKEIISLKDEIKNNKKQIEEFELEKRRKKEGYIISNENIDDKDKKEIDYKDEYEKMVLKVERYEYLIDIRDKQIEKLESQIEKEGNESNKNLKNKTLLSINNIEEENKTKRECNEKEIDNDDGSKQLPYKIIKKYKLKNNNAIYSMNNKKEKDTSIKMYKNKTNHNLNISQKPTKDNITAIKNKKINYISININNNKSIKKDSKSFQKKEKSISNKKSKERFNTNNSNTNNNNLHSLAKSNVSPNNQIVNNISLSDTDKLFINSNQILNLGSSVKINDNINNNIINISNKQKDKKSTLNKKREIRNTSNNNLINDKIVNKVKNINNNNENNIKYLLDKIYSKVKKDQKNQNEFLLFVKKLSKELHFNMINTSIKKSNININEEILNEKNKEIEDLKNQISLNRIKESDIKTNLNLLENEKNKLEEEKTKLTKEIQKFKIILDSKNYEQEPKNNPKKFSGIIHSDKNVLVMNDIDRLTTNTLNISPKKELEYFESLKFSDNDIIYGEKSSKYSFRKKKLFNKSPSLEDRNDLSFKRLFSNEDKNSNYEDESNNNDNDKNNLISNKMKELENNNIILNDEIKNLNDELKNLKVKENNLEMTNSSLIKENIELKQSLILIKDNYEKEFSLVSNSLINLTDKYQQIKRELIQKNKSKD